VKSGLKIIWIVIGLLLFLNTIIMAIITNFNSGIVIALGVSLVIAFYGLLMDRLYKIKWLNYTFLLGFTIMLIIMLFIAVYGKYNNVSYKEDAIIVLGAGIRGENVTLTLAHRLDKAVEYMEKNPGAIIVVSGGQGFGEDISEALAMERYLLKKGIPEEKMIKEQNSTSTYENCLFSKELLDKYFNKPYKTVIITNDFHIYRAIQISKTVGLDSTHYGAKTEWYTVPINYIRECAAVVKTWLLGAK